MRWTDSGLVSYGAPLASVGVHLASNGALLVTDVDQKCIKQTSSLFFQGAGGGGTGSRGGGTGGNLPPQLGSCGGAALQL